ncbi:MAG: AAA family ATPase [Planctomycetes bacterium]|nr:AAA family ATPase [Planctomycetota bacterium]
MPTLRPPIAEAVILIGIQATGKSTFVRTRLFDSHARINLDMLGTRHRESLLLQACLAAGQSFVVDNTNASRSERASYITLAKQHGFVVVGYYFQSAIDEALTRNATRDAGQRVPDLGVRGTHARLQIPSLEEGFDRLHYVRMGSKQADYDFHIEDWQP